MQLSVLRFKITLPFLSAHRARSALEPHCVFQGLNTQTSQILGVVLPHRRREVSEAHLWQCQWLILNHFQSLSIILTVTSAGIDWQPECRANTQQFSNQYNLPLTNTTFLALNYIWVSQFEDCFRFPLPPFQKQRSEGFPHWVILEAPQTEWCILSPNCEQTQTESRTNGRFCSGKVMWWHKWVAKNNCRIRTPPPPQKNITKSTFCVVSYGREDSQDLGGFCATTSSWRRPSALRPPAAPSWHWLIIIAFLMRCACEQHNEETTKRNTEEPWPQHNKGSFVQRGSWAIVNRNMTAWQRHQFKFRLNQKTGQRHQIQDQSAQDQHSWATTSESGINFGSAFILHHHPPLIIHHQHCSKHRRPKAAPGAVIGAGAAAAAAAIVAATSPTAATPTALKASLGEVDGRRPTARRPPLPNNNHYHNHNQHRLLHSSSSTSSQWPLGRPPRGQRRQQRGYDIRFRTMPLWPHARPLRGQRHNWATTSESGQRYYQQQQQ